MRVEDARLQQLVVTYENTVLNAQREVEDAMVAFVRAREEEQFLKDSVASAERSVEISMLQYKEGLVDYQRVLEALVQLNRCQKYMELNCLYQLDAKNCFESKTAFYDS